MTDTETYYESSSPWQHAEWFDAPATAVHHHPVVEKAMEVADTSGIAAHRFFEVAGRSRDALRAWVGQELIVTGPFSQILLSTAARIRNVHVRSMVVQVAYGEHNTMRGRLAPNAHPCLLDDFRASVGIRPDEVTVLPETAAFLADLRDQCSQSLLGALGALGVGNERLLVTEYAAVRRSFEAGWPDSRYQRFLDSNIVEDTAHSVFMADAADSLAGWGHEPQDFYDGALASVASRMRYYDALANRYGPARAR